MSTHYLELEKFLKHLEKQPEATTDKFKPGLMPKERLYGDGPSKLIIEISLLKQSLLTLNESEKEIVCICKDTGPGPLRETSEKSSSHFG